MQMLKKVYLVGTILLFSLSVSAGSKVLEVNKTISVSWADSTPNNPVSIPLTIEVTQGQMIDEMNKKCESLDVVDLNSRITSDQKIEATVKAVCYN